MFEIDLSGRTALITGASRGIGKACALYLGRAGANVVVNYRQDEDSAKKVVSAISDMGSQAVAIKADVSKPDEALALVKNAEESQGPIDIFVNNVGTGTRALISEITREDYDRVLDTNLRAFVTLAGAVVESMKKRRTGSIVGISSITGETGRAFLSGSPLYPAAKASVIGLVKGLAREGGPYGIRANVVCPGWTETDATANAPADVKASAIKLMPLGRTGVPDDIAGAVLFLASDLSSYVTGATIDVNGGLHIA